MGEQYEAVIGDEALEGSEIPEVESELGDGINDGTSNT